MCSKSSNKRTTIFHTYIFYIYIYLKGTDRTIFQVVNHKKKRKKGERNKNGWKKEKNTETNHEIIFHAFISLVGIGELLRANEKP